MPDSRRRRQKQRELRTNSICLGDVSDKSKVLNIALSGGGCLKVNRDNIGDLSACVGMFSPEDLNLIMRAIAQDTKAQEMQLEKEDMEGDGPPGGRGVNYENPLDNLLTAD